MKYLKKYKIFEDSGIDEIKSTLKDIFIEHEDDGKTVDIQLTRVFTESKDPAEYRIMISSGLNHPFYLEDIYNNVLIAMEYLKDYRFDLSNIHCDLVDKNSPYGPTQTSILSKYLFYDGGYEHIKNVKSKYSNSIIEEHPVWWIFLREFVSIRLRFKSKESGLTDMIIY